jgi:hypothetical protein
MILLNCFCLKLWTAFQLYRFSERINEGRRSKTIQIGKNYFKHYILAVISKVASYNL